VRANAATFSRVGLVVVALAACAWLLVQYHDAQLTASAKAITLDPYSTPSEIRTALDEASRTGTLNPDPYEARVFQALLEVRAGRRATAIKRLESVVRDQPSYVEAWRLLSQVSEQTDPELSARAAARVLMLDPLAGTVSRRR
jgi:predicted Zn-dependent protease